MVWKRSSDLQAFGNGFAMHHTTAMHCMHRNAQQCTIMHHNAPQGSVMVCKVCGKFYGVHFCAPQCTAIHRNALQAFHNISAMLLESPFVPSSTSR